MQESKVVVLKKESYQAAYQLAIPIIDDGKKIGNLLPIGNWIFAELCLIEKIARWRNKFNRMFPSQIPVTAESTAVHLESMVKDSDSILFLIEDEEQSVIGHIGAINISKTEFELAHLMRGEMTKKTDIVFYAEKALIKWCFSELRVMAAKIEVMTYNFGALSIHERIGFKLARKVPIRKIIDKNGIRHIVCKESEANVKYQIVQYRLDADSFYSL